MSKLALLGGNKSIQTEPADAFKWPIVTQEMEAKVLEVLRAGNMSGIDVTRQFERGFADWHGMQYGLGCNNGTSALHCAMFGAGIGEGDEVICPAVTYWASCLQVLSLGGKVVFADIDPETLCLDPDDIERRVSAKTKAIVVVHYCGRPADMDRIMANARKHKLKVIEDVSHAHGAMYKGKIVGTFGAVAGFSVMSEKSFAIGEAGIMLTNDRTIYERAVLLGHYERHAKEVSLPEMKRWAGLPWGGYKYRMHQLSAAVGLAQLKKYPQEMAAIDKAMNYFWDLLEGLPGIRSCRPPKNSGITMGGWYNSLGRYFADELGGLSVNRFCEALIAEGVRSGPAGLRPGCNKALHLHPLFNTVDVYRQGRPTNFIEGYKQPCLPVSEGIQRKVFTVPWFKRYCPKLIEEYTAAFRKVVKNYKELLAGDAGNPENGGGWNLSGLR